MSCRARNWKCSLWIMVWDGERYGARSGTKSFGTSGFPIYSLPVSCYSVLVTQTHVEPSEIARQIVDALTDRQAEDVILLDIHDIASFADYFVIGTALNPRHMTALLNAMD